MAIKRLSSYHQMKARQKYLRAYREERAMTKSMTVNYPARGIGINLPDPLCCNVVGNLCAKCKAARSSAPRSGAAASRRTRNVGPVEMPEGDEMPEPDGLPPEIQSAVDDLAALLTKAGMEQAGMAALRDALQGSTTPPGEEQEVETPEVTNRRRGLARSPLASEPDVLPVVNVNDLLIDDLRAVRAERAARGAGRANDAGDAPLGFQYL